MSAERHGAIELKSGGEAVSRLCDVRYHESAPQRSEILDVVRNFINFETSHPLKMTDGQEVRPGT